MTSDSLSKGRAYQGLVEMIVSGQIREEESLSERGLSERLGFGRTPIREAIKDLVRDGLLESHPVRGTVLKSLTLGDLQDLYEVRFALEGLAAFLAAERGDLTEIARQAALIESAMDAPGSVALEDVHIAGVECHHLLVKASGNRRLEEMYRPFRIRFGGPLVLSPDRSSARILQAASEHLAILRAVLVRDPLEARDLMCRHLQAGLEHRSDLLLKRSAYSRSTRQMTTEKPD